METLVCESCESEWDRERARGRKPRVCPPCKSGDSLVVSPVKSAGVDKASVEYYIFHYGYVPPKKSTYCSGDMHKTCSKFGYFAESKYACRCKCHA